MTKYLSDKLTIVSTILMIMVVRVHATYVDQPGISNLSIFVFKFFSGGYKIFVVPMFFCISGYLFANNINNCNDCATKLKKKIKTLVIPYFLWNLIFALYYVALDIIPWARKFNNHPDAITSLFNVPITGTISDLFIRPFACQLWFLRDLIILFIFAPFLWLVAKQKWWLILLLLSISLVPLYTYQIYFVIGIIIGAQNWNISRAQHSWWITYIPITVFLAYNVYCSLNMIIVPKYVAVIMSFCGMFAIWILYDAISKGECYSTKGVWKHICGYSFFLYCCHEPALNIFRKFFPEIFGHNNITYLVFYFLNVWIMVTIAIMIAKFLEKRVPKVYHVLSGGR